MYAARRRSAGAGDGLERHLDARGRASAPRFTKVPWKVREVDDRVGDLVEVVVVEERDLQPQAAAQRAAARRRASKVRLRSGFRSGLPCAKNEMPKRLEEARLLDPRARAGPHASWRRRRPARARPGRPGARRACRSCRCARGGRPRSGRRGRRGPAVLQVDADVGARRREQLARPCAQLAGLALDVDAGGERGGGVRPGPRAGSRRTGARCRSGSPRDREVEDREGPGLGPGRRA